MTIAGWNIRREREKLNSTLKTSGKAKHGQTRRSFCLASSLCLCASGFKPRTGAAMTVATSEQAKLAVNGGPKEIEKKITPRTKAVMVVHYCGHPCDMDAIVSICRKHKLKLIEDCSHAHGTMYKGRMVGTFGDVSAASLMASKSLPAGEGGMLWTNDRSIFERAIAFAHYERQKSDIKDPALKQIAAPDNIPSGIPMGGMTGRMNQACT